MKNVIVTIFVILLLACTLWSATAYVDINASGSNDGSDWTNAYTSLQSALDAAGVGGIDEIWIAKGTYYPSSYYDLGARSTYFHFRMINGVTIYGGFTGTESAVSERTDYAPGGANETILSGNIGAQDGYEGSTYHVFFHNSIGLDNTAVLDGVTISDGMALYETVEEHTCGGGMYNYSCTPTLVNVSFINNQAYYGGGLYNARASLQMTNCIFRGNQATLFGGGLYNAACTPVLLNGVFSGNTCDGSGGGIALASSSMLITNATITSNSADNGGGLYSNGSDPELYNCINWGNTATTSGNEFYIESNTTTLNYSCYGNDAGDVYNNGTLTTTNNNITTDPCFVGAASNAAHPYSISGISPCTDTGNDSYNSESYDIRGFARKLDKTSGAAGTIDMGAYEYKVGDDALPVELSSLSALCENGSVLLEWTTASETDNLGFIIERRAGQNVWRQIASYSTRTELEGQGTTSAQHAYSFCDESIAPGQAYTYRLSDTDIYGNTNILDYVTVETSSLPASTVLYNAYPNPFNPNTNLKYHLAQDGHVNITVYDMLGREIKVLVNKQLSAGEYSLTWDGSMNDNSIAVSGIYLVRMQTAQNTQIQKVTLLK